MKKLFAALLAATLVTTPSFATSTRVLDGQILTNTGATITFPTSTDTLVGRTTSDTLTNKTFTAPTFNFGTFNEAAAPATPASGKTVLYVKADGLFYSKDDAGVETLVSGGSGSGANTSLSNLVTTDINQNFIFNTGGSATIKTKDTAVASESVFLLTGTPTNTNINSGGLNIKSGNVTGTGSPGHILLSVGSSVTPSAQGEIGHLARTVRFYGYAGDAGFEKIILGTQGGLASDSGYQIETADSTAGNVTQTLNIGTGNATAGTTSGSINMFSGGSAGSSGAISLYTGTPDANSSSGALDFKSGDAAGTGNSGSTNIHSGATVDGDTGNILIAVPKPSGSGSRGEVAVSATHLRISDDTNTVAMPALFYDLDNTNYTGIKAADVTTETGVYELPPADGSSGQCLSTNGSFVLSWVACSGGSFANQALSNLASVAVNTSLIFGTGVAGEIKSKDSATGSATMRVASGETTAADVDSGAITVTSGAVSGTGNSGAISIITGAGVDGTTGDIVLQPGTESGSGTRGKILIDESVIPLTDSVYNIGSATGPLRMLNVFTDEVSSAGGSLKLNSGGSGIDASSNGIQNLSGPSTGTDAANKAYVDITTTGTRGSPILISAGTAIFADQSSHHQLRFIAGNGAPVVMTANPQIDTGAFVGQEYTIISRHATNTVTLADGNGLSINGAWVGGLDSVLNLIWDGSVWVETSRR